MLIFAYFTLGMLARFFTVVRPPFTADEKKRFKLAAVVIMFVIPSAYLVFISEGMEFTQEMLIIYLFSFAFILAVAFQKRLAPVVTNGALLVYGLAGLFLSFSTAVFWQIALGLCCAVVLFLCLTKKTVPRWGQVLLVYAFLALQIFLIWMFSWQYISDAFSLVHIVPIDGPSIAPLLTPTEALLAGYIFFTATCNVVIFFVLPPLHASIGTSRPLSYGELIESSMGIYFATKKHLSFLQTRYNEKGVSLHLIIVIVCLFCALWLNESFQILSSLSAISLFLIVGILLTTDFEVKVLNAKETHP